MEITIIGVYDEYSHAQSAKNELLASGYPRRSVQLNPDHELSTAPATAIQPGNDGSVSASIGNFFRSLFGVGDKSTHSNVYAEAVRRGSYVLTVDTDSDEQRVRAEEIMNRYGTVDIEERSAQWMRHGWRGYDPSAPMMTPEEIRRERRTYSGEQAAQRRGDAARAFRRGKETPGQK